MRLDKIWTVSKKDLAEFRTNKYIMFSLILMPLLLAIVLPVLYLTPFTTFSSNPTDHPLDLGLSMEGNPIVGGNYNATGFTDQVITGANLNNSVLVGCEIEHCTLTNSSGQGKFHWK